jgi:hypothetical protein
MSRRHEQNTGTRDVRDAHRFDEQQLLDYLSSHVESFQGPLTVRQFKGGQSNPTYLLDAGSGRYVLRRKPPGKLLKSAHAVDREFRVISALYAAGFPVPRPVVLCKDDEVIGTMFFVMEFVEGRIFWDLDLPGLDGDARFTTTSTRLSLICTITIMERLVSKTMASQVITSRGRFHAGPDNIARRRPLRLKPWTRSSNGCQKISRTMTRRVLSMATFAWTI